VILIRKYLSSIIAAMLVIVTFYVIFGPGSGIAEASSPTYCWLGYSGNDTVYMTTGACKLFLNNMTDSGDTFNKTCVRNDFQTSNVNSALAMAVGRHNSASDVGSFCEGYRSSFAALQVSIPIAVSGFTRATNLSQDCAIQKRFDSIWYNHISSSVWGLGPTVKNLMSVCRNVDGGMNTSGTTNDKSNNLIPVYISIGGLALAAMAFVPGLDIADIGMAYAMMSTGDSILNYEYTTASSSSDLLGTTTSNSTLWQNFFVDNGSLTARAVCINGQKIPDCNFTSYYSSQEDIVLCIPCFDFSNSGHITINGTSYCSPQECVASGIPVMNASLKIPIVPAYTLSGVVRNDGCPDSNARVHIEQSCERTSVPYPEYICSSFCVPTNSKGDFKFYAQPGDTYAVSLKGFSQETCFLSSAPNDHGSSSCIIFNVGTLNFNNGGSVNGNPWSVSVNGVMKASSADLISFEEEFSSGGTTFSYSSWSTGYSSSSGSGSVELEPSNSISTISISFYSTASYTVTFSESGLPSDTQWTVDVAGKLKSSTGTSISFTEPNGVFGFSVSASNSYNPSPSSGSITVSGNSFTKGISFSAPSGGGGGGGGSGCVNATTEILMANYTYMQAQYVLPGDYVLAYNVTTHAYQKEEVLDTYVSNHSRMYTINGILETSAYQPILTSQGYVQAQNLTTKDRIYDAFTGRYVKVTSITLSNGNYTMYDFQIPPDYDFIAWGYVVYDLTREP
jgi:hypothetical protein